MPCRISLTLQSRYNFFTYQERIPANLIMTPAGYGHPTAILVLIHLTILSSQPHKIH